MVSDYCESCTVLFLFLWLHAEDEFLVSHVFLAIVWNGLPYDECDFVGWVLYSSDESICEASELICRGHAPIFLVF